MIRRLARPFVALLLLLGSIGSADPAGALCMLSNPSFEIDGGGAPVFGGWEQFGIVGVTGPAGHGQQAARLEGPSWGSWAVSAYWQRLDGQPGESWEVTGLVRHASGMPLTHDSKALVNVEWRDAAGAMIDYQSHAAAASGSPTDTYLEFDFVSDPAPAGTASIHVLLGLLQDPSGSIAEVLFDRVACHSLSSPTMDELQWNDFPGGRVLEFAERSWRVKGPGWYGPGPNSFADDETSVWVDGAGDLHLTIMNRGGSWYSTEVVLEDAMGYGDYIFTTRGRLDLLDPHAVLGLFLWQYPPCWDEEQIWWNPANEIDVEFSRWGDPGREIAQFVVQPWDWPSNMNRFDVTYAPGELASHAFRWLPDRVEFRSWRGGPHDETPETLVHAWTYTGVHVPRPEQPRVHMNLWRVTANPAADQEVVMDDFRFIPQGSTAAGEGPGGALPRPVARLLAPGPNPFNPSTSLRYELFRNAHVEVAVHDIAGRRLRVLVDGYLEAGSHAVNWDGRDARGHALASGVYLCSLRAEGLRATRRVVLIK